MLGSWIACITGCLCFGCVYNWLPVLALPVQPQQPVIQAIQPSTGNQLYRQPKHRQPVIQAAQAQATSYTRSASTGNQLYTQRKHRQRKHRQPVIQAAKAQATRYTARVSTGNHLYTQPKHRQPVIQAAKTQATSYTRSQSTGNQLYRQSRTQAHATTCITGCLCLRCLCNWLPVLALPV